MVCGYVAVSQGDAVAELKVGDHAQQFLPVLPDLAGHRQRDIRLDFGQCLHEQVQSLVAAHHPEEEQPALRRPLLARPRSRAVNLGQVQRQRRDIDRRAGQRARDRGLLGRVHDHGIGCPQQRPHGGLVEPAALVRQHVVAQGNHGAATRPRGPRQHDVGRDLDRGEDRDNDGVVAAGGQPAAGQPPAVRPVPGQRPFGVIEQRHLGAVDGELARVQEPRVLGVPGDERDLVTRGREPVRQLGRVLGRATFIRVGRADDGDLQPGSPRSRGQDKL